MFTLNHFIWLLACGIIIAIGLILSKRFNLKFKTAALIVFVISMLSELSKMNSNFILSSAKEGGYILNPRSLPFHLCSILIFVIAYISFTKNEDMRNKCISFLVPIGICGGILAMLIPTNGVDFLDIDAYQCFVYHSGLLWFSLYLVITKQVDLSIKAYKRNLLILMLLFIGSIYINSILSSYGTNFFFTSRPPMSNLPILNLDNGYVPYLLTILFAGFILVSIVHLPTIIKETKKKH